MDIPQLRMAFQAGACVSLVYVFWPQLTVWFDRTREPGCGACRHPVRDTASVHCAGCGADLRLCGIVTPTLVRRPPFTLVRAVLLWTCLWCFLGLAVVFLTESLPSYRINIRTSGYSPVDTTRARAVLPGDLNLAWRREGWGDPAADGEFTLKYDVADKAENAGQVRCAWPSRVILASSGTADHLRPGAALSDEALTSWFGRINLPEAVRPQYSAEVQSLMAAISAGKGPILSVWSPGGGSTSNLRVTPWWVGVAVGASWAAVWPVGAVVVVARNRRRALGLATRPA